MLLAQAKMVSPKKTELMCVNNCKSSIKLISTEQARVIQQTMIMKE